MVGAAISNTAKSWRRGFIVEHPLLFSGVWRNLSSYHKPCGFVGFRILLPPMLSPAADGLASGITACAACANT
jgi:hypothetical protein